MENKTDESQHQRLDTRPERKETPPSLADNRETPGDRVRDTVMGATSTAQEALETVKDTLGETVGTVQATMERTAATVTRAFDIKAQMDQHPWLILSGAVLTGYVLGGLEMRPSAVSSYQTGQTKTETEPTRSAYVAPTAEPEAETPSAAARSQSGTAGFWHYPLAWFQEEVDYLKGAAMVGLLRNLQEMATYSWPVLASRMEKAVASATKKLDNPPRRDE